MENRIYVSYLTTPGASGTYEINLTTYDCSPNITLTATITGTETTDTEEIMASRALTQLNTILTQYDCLYEGVAGIFPGTPAATFRATRTGHCLCVFSESQFSLTISNNSPGAIIKVESDPGLITVSKMSSQADILGQDLTDGSGQDLTNSQIADLIMIISSRLVQVLRNPIVSSTYRFETFTNFTNGVKLPKVPILSVDSPYIRRPDVLSFISNASITSEPLNAYHIDYKTGWMSYRYAQDMLLAYEPFDYNNSFRLTYVAGERQIPTVVQNCVVDLANAILNDPDVAKLSGGTFSVEPKHFSHILTEKLQFLKQYMLPNG